ncbi:MAG: hypothetical protein V1676_05520 [Candidatus Diapherotrites archaeon]
MTRLKELSIKHGEEPAALAQQYYVAAKEAGQPCHGRELAGALLISVFRKNPALLQECAGILEKRYSLKRKEVHGKFESQKALRLENHFALAASYCKKIANSKIEAKKFIGMASGFSKLIGAEEKVKELVSDPEFVERMKAYFGGKFK